MVKFRNVTIAVMSQWGMQPHPEFPHPDTTAAAVPDDEPILNQEDAQSASPSSSPSMVSISKADRILGRKPYVSVYIPSIAGTRFWIRWAVEALSPDDYIYFFKLSMDGRHVTSWGTDPNRRPSGQCMRALYKPGDSFNHGINDEDAHDEGLESRAFYFASDENDDPAAEKQAKAAANHGGEIHIQIFRANARRRRMPEIPSFRGQPKYGISLPSSGMLENPEDTRFYDWVLIEPKEAPYATFSFHYRSWESLTDLQLISLDHPRTLSSSTTDGILSGIRIPSGIPSGNTNSILRHSLTYAETLAEEAALQEKRAISNLKAIMQRNADVYGRPFVTEEPKETEYRNPTPPIKHQSPQSPQGPRPLRQVPSYRALGGDVFHSPVASPSTRSDSFLTRESRKSSAESLAPSITPSLREYVEEDPGDSPPHVFGVASIGIPAASTDLSLLVDSPSRDTSPSQSFHTAPTSHSVNALPFSSPFITSPPLLSFTHPNDQPPSSLGLTAISPNITVRRSSARPDPHVLLSLPRMQSLRSKFLHESQYLTADAQNGEENPHVLAPTEGEWLRSVTLHDYLTNLDESLQLESQSPSALAKSRNTLAATTGENGLVGRLRKNSVEKANSRMSADDAVRKQGGNWI